jgi:hypothetical protein
MTCTSCQQPVAPDELTTHACPPQPPPVKTVCHHCDGTGTRSRTVRPHGECTATWWDMTGHPFQEWTCGRPLRPGQTQYCSEHQRQADYANQKKGLP